jgi:phospholipase D1/2
MQELGLDRIENELSQGNPTGDPLIEFKNQSDNMARYLTHITMSVEGETQTNEVMAYLGISHPAFELNYSKIGEVAIRKKAQGRDTSSAIGKCIKGLFTRWQKRWLVIGHHSLWYYGAYDDEPFAIRDNIQVDNTAMVNWTSITNKGVEVTLNFARRELVLAVDNLIDGLNAIHYFTQLFKVNEYCKVHQFQAFSPKRKDNHVQFFSDGETYFEKVFDLMRVAEREILICGWMISPEMPLKRPFLGKLTDPCNVIIGKDDVGSYEEEREALLLDTRLCRVLKSMATRGVNVYILVYKEFSMKMFNDSEHVEKTLMQLHPRIKVLRHPNKVFSLWSHHEKSVIVDRKVAMVGGLDLTWGRWDTCEHPLFEKGEENTGFFFPGVDFYNPMKKDIEKGRYYQSCLLSNPKMTPRMPWHDVATMLAGPVVKDFVSHFIGYWNHAKDVCGEREVLFQQMALKDGNGKFMDHADSEEIHSEIVDLFASLNIQNFIEKNKENADYEEVKLNPEVNKVDSGSRIGV